MKKLLALGPCEALTIKNGKLATSSIQRPNFKAV